MTVFNNTTKANQLYPVANAVTSSNPFVVEFQSRAPTVNDINFPIQKYWLDTSLNDFWFLKNFTSAGGVVEANWIRIGGGIADLVSLSDTANTVVFPSLSSDTPPNNIQLINLDGGITITSDAPDNRIIFGLTGGGAAIDSVGVDASTPPGTNPVLPDGSGEIFVTGGQVASGVVNPNVIRTDSLAVNTYTIEIQRSTTAAMPTVGLNGVSHFDSTQFTVDADGFVQALGGLPYISLSPFIVGTDIHSGFATIASAITAAVLAGATAATPMNVYIKPKADGTAYTENLTLQPGVNLIGFGQTPTIIGKLTYSQTGRVFIEGLTLQTNSDFIFEVTGANSPFLEVENCQLNITNNTAISLTATTGVIVLENCQGDVATTGITLFAVSGGLLAFTFSFFGNSGLSTTSSTLSAGSVNTDFSAFSSPISVTATGTLSFRSSVIDTNAINTTALTLSSNQESFSRSGLIQSGTAIAITINNPAILVVTGTEVNCANAIQISGTGELRYADIQFSFAGASSTITTVSQVPFPWKPFTTSGTSVTAVRGTAAFDSTQFTVTDGFVQLTGAGGSVWTDASGTFSAAVNNGYFLTAASTITLAATTTNGDSAMFICDTASNVIITANAGQRIRIGSSQSSVAGTATSAVIGNAINLRYRNADSTWFSQGGPEGTWSLA